MYRSKYKKLTLYVTIFYAKHQKINKKIRQKFYLLTSSDSNRAQSYNFLFLYLETSLEVFSFLLSPRTHSSYSCKFAFPISYNFTSVRFSLTRWSLVRCEASLCLDRSMTSCSLDANVLSRTRDSSASSGGWK